MMSYRGGVWELTDTVNDGHGVLTIPPGRLDLPVGRKVWDMKDLQCGIKATNLTLSNCEAPDQFTCHTGQCVTIYRRCDNRRDCLDGSDEEQCVEIDLPSTYNKVAPPEQPRDATEANPIYTQVARQQNIY